MTHNQPPVPASFPPPDQWPILTGPHCPACQTDAPGDVVWIGTANDLDTGDKVHLWTCRACCTDWTIPITHWPILDGPDCPYCATESTFWAAIDPDHDGDLWMCEQGHEFVLTPEGVIVLPEDAA
ncbi:hypothetical protein ACGFNU_23475 [Spirillospora sp. NPDC048911]|uniref:hypothetical protein n=1 Tax=Spirillospora sp. NPDC048911 TaxID=3364527 RepID=UPI003713F7F4